MRAVLVPQITTLVIAALRVPRASSAQTNKQHNLVLQVLTVWMEHRLVHYATPAPIRMLRDNRRARHAMTGIMLLWSVVHNVRYVLTDNGVMQATVRAQLQRAATGSSVLQVPAVGVLLEQLQQLVISCVARVLLDRIVLAVRHLYNVLPESTVVPGKVAALRVTRVHTQVVREVQPVPRVLMVPLPQQPVPPHVQHVPP